MKIIFFSKRLKFDVDSRYRTKEWIEVFGFQGNCIWFGDVQFSPSRTGYLSSAVSVLRNTPKNWHITKGDIFQIKFSQSNEKIWWKCSHADFTRVWDPLTCWLSKGVPERYFLESGLTTLFTFCNFRNKVGMAIIFFFKMFKIWCRFQKWKKKIRKNSWF